MVMVLPLWLLGKVVLQACISHSEPAAVTSALLGDSSDHSCAASTVRKQPKVALGNQQHRQLSARFAPTGCCAVSCCMQPGIVQCCMRNSCRAWCPGAPGALQNPDTQPQAPIDPEVLAAAEANQPSDSVRIMAGKLNEAVGGE